MTDVVVRDGEVFAETRGEDEPENAAATLDRAAEYRVLMDRAEKLWPDGHESGEDQEGRSEPAAAPRLAAVLIERAPSVRVPLAWPVVVEGETISEVALWPPVYADVDAMMDDEISTVELINRMAGRPAGFIQALRFPDATNVINHAFGVAPQIRRLV